MLLNYVKYVVLLWCMNIEALQTQEENNILYGVGKFFHTPPNRAKSYIKSEGHICHGTALNIGMRYVATTCDCALLMDRDKLSDHKYHIKLIPRKDGYYYEQRTESTTFPPSLKVVQYSVILSVKHPKCENSHGIYTYNFAVMRTATDMLTPSIFIPSIRNNDSEVAIKQLGGKSNCYSYILDEAYNLTSCLMWGSGVDTHDKIHGWTTDINETATACVISHKCKSMDGLPICCGSEVLRCFGLGAGSCEENDINIILFTALYKEEFGLNDVTTYWSDNMMIEDSNDPRSRYIRFDLIKPSFKNSSHHISNENYYIIFITFCMIYQILRI